MAVIAGCPACGYALASANWQFRYKSGQEREATLCARCGFTQAARGAIVGTTLAAVGAIVRRQHRDSHKPPELLRLQAQLANVRERLREFQR